MRVIQSFQSTYWTRQGWAADGEQTSESVLVKYPLRRILLAASVTSWIIYAPNYRRVLYVDKPSYNILKEWRWIGLWHEVHQVNFQDKLKGITFYASSKPFTWTLQSEPFWSVDLDCYLKQPIDPDWFDSREWYGETYKTPLVWNPKEIAPGVLAETKASEWYNQYYSRAKGTYIEKLDRMQAVNAGMVFCPNADQANLIGLATLELMRQMSKAEWNSGAQVIEEVPLANWVPIFGQKIKPLVNNTFYHHHYSTKNKDREELDQKVVEEIKQDLGYDPIAVVEKLSKQLESKETVEKNIKTII